MKSYHDIVGDGGSDVLAQVQEQRARLGESLAGVRYRMAIASGKGGVGKSTLTQQLAGALAQRGWSVAVLDADLDGPSQARLGGVRSQPPLPGERGMVLPRNRDGIGILSLGSFLTDGEALRLPTVAEGESFTWRATQEATLLRQILAGVEWGRLDALLVDLPPGAERTLQMAELLGPSTDFVLVTIPSALARGVVARSADSLAGSPNRVLGYISNMDGYACAGCGEVGPLFPPTEEVEITLPLLGRVPFDPDLAALGDRGVSWSEAPETAATRAIDEIAERLQTLLETP